MTDYRLYNPALLSDDQLRRSFVARTRQYQQLIRLIREEPSEGALQHALIIGSRGVGKTTLGLRVLLEVKEDPQLARKWQPVPFFEESYGITDLAGFWLTALKHLSEVTGQKQWAATVEHLTQKERNKDRLEAGAIGALLDFCDTNAKRLILFVENLDEIFSQFLDPNEVYRLRATLQERADFLVLGTANSTFSQISSRGEPFYEFFRQVRLSGLSSHETRAFLKQMAEDPENEMLRRVLENDPGRIEVIRRFTGGNPRLIGLAARMICESPMGAARDDLERLIDEQTPYFKARIEQLAPQPRAIFHTLAAGWRPMLAREVAAGARLSSSQASAQLKKLKQMGYVEAIAGRSTRARYQVLERFYNIYYLLRFTRDQRVRLERLIDFITQMFGRGAIAGMAQATLLRLRQLSSASADEWAAIAVLAPRLSVPRHAPSDLDSKTLLQEALRIGNDLKADLPPELLRHGFEALQNDHAALQEFIVAARRYVHGHPDNIIVAISLAIALVICERASEAFDVISRAMAISDERDPILLFVRGVLSANVGKMDDAERDLAEAASRSPENEMVGLQYARFLLRKNRASDAYALLEHLKTEVNPEVWQVRAETLVQMDEHKRAELAARKAIDLDRSSPEGWFWLGQSLYGQRRFPDAAGALDHAIALAPAHVGARRSLVRAYEALGRPRDAENIVNLLVQKEPSGSDWDFAGDFFLRQDRLEDAERAYRTALELDPNSAVRYGNLALLYLTKEQWSEAESYLRRAVELDENFPLLKPMLGVALASQGKLAEAQKCLLSGLEGAGYGDVILRAYLLVVLLSDREQATRLANLGLAKTPPGSRDVLVFCALTFSELEDWTKVFEILKSALTRDDLPLSGRELSVVTNTLIAAVAAGKASEALELLSNEKLGAALEPLLHAVRQELGEAEEPLPMEIADAVKEVRDQIRKNHAGRTGKMERVSSATDGMRAAIAAGQEDSK